MLYLLCIDMLFFSFIITADMLYICFSKESRFITNSLSRDNLGFGNSKSSKLFNKLMESDKIEIICT